MSGISIRKITKEDLPLLLAWSHIKEIWDYLPSSRSGEILTWEEHWKWWESREDREDWIINVQSGNYGWRPVGVLIVNLKSLEIGIYIGEVTLWGKGVGKAALELLLYQLKRKGHDHVQALVHPDNLRSQRLFKSLGFKKIGIGRREQDLYERPLD